MTHNVRGSRDYSAREVTSSLGGEVYGHRPLPSSLAQGHAALDTGDENQRHCIHLAETFAKRRGPPRRPPMIVTIDKSIHRAIEFFGGPRSAKGSLAFAPRMPGARQAILDATLPDCFILPPSK